MSQYRSGASPQPQPRRGGISGGAYLLSALILGICILIAGLNISGSVKKLNETISTTEFGTNVSSPSDLTVNTVTQKKYLTQSEAAAYLNISESDISDAISQGKISEYIITSTGYSISITALDDYFEQEAYQIQIKNNSLSEE